VKRKADRPPGRKQRALATRRRMLRAAYELFCERGYAATTMDLIAAQAGVAVQTLYFTFHTKAAILEESVGAAVLGFDLWDPRWEPAIAADPRKAFREHHPWFPALERARSQRAALEVFVDASLEILRRVAPLAVVVASAAASDPQMKRAAELGEHRRVEGFQVVVEMLAKQGKLRRGVSVRRATDILLTVLSAETYQHLAIRRGWSEAECREWFVQVLEQQLLR
jgi:AcrR family transcriptional regulator